jgi:phage baseplate assembly protein W
MSGRPGSNDVAVAFPLALGPSDGTQMTTSRAAAAEQLIEQLLFTDRGERLNRPDLGCGLIELVFDALSDELRTATQFQVASALQHWLGDVVRVTSVVTGGSDAELDVTVSYQPVGASETRTATFRR